MKFDYCVGNPPYQGDSDNNGRKPPVYNHFMDEAYEFANAVEMITPARFLFDAGHTPNEWNKKMLNDEHLKVLMYEPDAKKVFSNTEIKGGVAITIRDISKNYGKIGIYTAHEELNRILHNVLNNVPNEAGFLNTIIAPQGFYKFDNCAFSEHPEILQVTGQGTKRKITSRIIELLPKVFMSTPTNTEECLELLGRVNNTRTIKYIPRRYVSKNDYIDKFNVILPKASGTGSFGEVLAMPDILKPGQVTSDTFVSVGSFDSVALADNVATYLKTKFLRTLMGILKVTHDVTSDKFKYVPLQDFTDNSDIDWSQSISDIDQQLYRKYGLSEEEIRFIETHVKAME